MVGPDRSVHGGISAVVNNLYDAGLDKMVNLTYIGTMKDGSRFRKLLIAGNGGSAADSEHIAGELMKRFKTSYRN